MILGVTGTNGAGKGTVVSYLESKGFHHYSVSKKLAEELTLRGIEINRPNLGQMGNELRAKHGAEYFDKLFIEDAKEKGYEDFIIESVRSMHGAQWLKAQGALLLAVDADRKLRYERVVLRGSATDQVDFDTWVAEEEREWHNEAAHDMNVPGVITLADFKIENNGSLAELHAKLDGFLLEIKK